MLRPNQFLRQHTDSRLRAMADRARRDRAYYNRLLRMYGSLWSLRHSHRHQTPVGRDPQTHATYQDWGHYLGRELAFQRQRRGTTNMRGSAAVLLVTELNQSRTNASHRWSRCPYQVARAFVDAVDGMEDVRNCPECETWYVNPNAIEGDREVTCSECEDDTYQDSDGYGDSLGRDGVASYHDHPLRSNAVGYFREQSTADNPAIGMELEVYCEDRRALAQAMDGYIIEDDGSLDESYGLEIVFPPNTLGQWAVEVPSICGRLLRIGTRAYRAPGGVYGVHLTVHRRHLSPLQEARMALFLTAEENADFVRAVGQRQSVYSADSTTQDIGALGTHRQTIASLNGLQERRWNVKHRKIAGLTKFSALHFKPDLLECRIFHATLKAESLLKHIEFYAALIQWTRPQSATGSRWHHRDFYAWLMAGRQADYPNLCEYLARPTYVVRRGVGSITNTWHRPALQRAA